MASSTLGVIAVGTFGGGVVGLGLAWFAWRHDDVPAAVPYGWLSFTSAVWSFAEVAYLLARDPTVAAWLNRVILFPAYLVAPLWLVFAVVYTGHRDWLSPARVGALLAPFLAYGLLRLTAPLHGIGAVTVSLRTVGGVTAPVAAENEITAAATAFSYLYILAGYAILARFLIRSRHASRKQTLVIIAGSLFPLAGNVAYQLQVNVHPGANLTPMLFVVNGLVVGWALFRYEFRDVAPLARDVLVDELPDPVLVLGADQTVIDHNPAAARLADGDLVDRHVDDIQPGLDAHLETERTFTADAGEAFGSENGVAAFEPRTVPLEDQHGRSRGQLVVLRNVSTQQRRLQQLEAMQAATERFIGARTEEEVARIAVEFASDVLDKPHAVLLTYDEGDDVFRPQAITDAAADLFGSSVEFPADGSPLWTAFETGTVRVLQDLSVVEANAAEGEPPATLALPVGEFGLLLIGTDGDAGLSMADEQFARILASTTETALTRVEHERALRERGAALQRRNEQIEFFNGVLRHNLRNSMMVIDGHAEFLAESLEGGDEQLATIREWCADLTELTEKIRAITDTVTASESERLDEVDVSRVLVETAEAVDAEYDDATVEVDADAGTAYRVCANDLVEDVVESVVRNAVEHNDKPEPRVRVTTERIADRLQIRVADNGPGLSEEMKERVFERDVATSQTAHGFGLYFVSVMMDLYGGTVYFEDNDPTGAVAVLEFELTDPDDAGTGAAVDA